MVISSLATKAAIGLVSLGAATAAGVGIWKLHPKSGNKIQLPDGYRWLEIEGSRDSENWKRRYKEVPVIKENRELDGVKKLQNICLDLKNKEYEKEIPLEDKNRALGWCGWNDLENMGGELPGVT